MLRGMLVAASVVFFSASLAQAGEWTRADSQAYRRASVSSWHGDYYHYQYGRPLALVVPPTAHMQSSYNWGVAQTRMMPIYHQFGRNYYGESGYTPGPFQPTPLWPSSTDQFGVYYVRGPW